MKRTRHTALPPIRIRRYTLALMAAWSAAVGGLLVWEIAQVHRVARELATGEARADVAKDLSVFRFWAKTHGNVYVAVDEQAASGPHITDALNGTLETSDGVRLARLTPSQMVRRMQDQAAESCGVHAHVASLRPIGEQAIPDAWERRALEALERGAPEVSEFGKADGESRLRLMTPIVARSECLGCHEHGDYLIGDIMGGIAVSLPTSPFLARAREAMVIQPPSHVVLWLLGLGGVALTSARLSRQIRRRGEAEAALREQQSQLRTIFAATPDSLALKDRDLVYRAVNPAYCRLLDRPEEEIIGKTDHDLLPRDLAAACRGNQTAVLTSGLPQFRDEEQAGPEGKRWCQTATVPVIAPDGDCRGLLVSIRDMTERKRIEQALLREREEHIRLLLDSTAEGICGVDLEGRCTFVNPAGAQMLGYASSDRLIGRKLHELLHHRGPEDATPRRENGCRSCEALRSGQRVHVAEGAIRRADGTCFPIEYWAHPITRDDKAVGTVLTFLDITERKRGEEERRRLEAQMQHAQKLESLGVLAGGIAHDFNNLLVGVLGNAALALEDLPADSPVREQVSQIETAAERAAGLAKQMLAYSGKGTFVVKPIMLSQLVTETARLLEASIPKTLTLTCDVRQDLPAIQGDQSQLLQVVMNLITNAAEAIGERHGRVTVRTGVVGADRVNPSEARHSDGVPEGDYAYVEVTDTGCGMDDKTQAKMFDPFFTTKFAGRGLGLAATLGIVRGHHGVITVRSKPGQGTSIRVLFPARVEAVEPETPRQPPTAGGAERRTILVVDDEEPVRSLARTAIERSGLTVLTAGNGHEALHLFRRHRHTIDAVLLDMTMPRASGAEVFEEMRRLRPDVRIVLTSGYDEQETVGRLGGATPAGFIQKPYRPGALVQKLRQTTCTG